MSCHLFAQTGSCKYGKTCKFIHHTQYKDDRYRSYSSYNNRRYREKPSRNHRSVNDAMTSSIKDILHWKPTSIERHSPTENKRSNTKRSRNEFENNNRLKNEKYSPMKKLRKKSIGNPEIKNAIISKNQLISIPSQNKTQPKLKVRRIIKNENESKKNVKIRMKIENELKEITTKEIKSETPLTIKQLIVNNAAQKLKKGINKNVTKAVLAMPASSVLAIEERIADIAANAKNVNIVNTEKIHLKKNKKTNANIKKIDHQKRRKERKDYGKYSSDSDSFSGSYSYYSDSYSMTDYSYSHSPESHSRKNNHSRRRNSRRRRKDYGHSSINDERAKNEKRNDERQKQKGNENKMVLSEKGLNIIEKYLKLDEMANEWLGEEICERIRYPMVTESKESLVVKDKKLSKSAFDSSCDRFYHILNSSEFV